MSFSSEFDYDRVGRPHERPFLQQLKDVAASNLRAATKFTVAVSVWLPLIIGIILIYGIAVAYLRKCRAHSKRRAKRRPATQEGPS
jgi:hypothetical protein